MTSSSKINLTTATIIGMNAMIGAGIFALPAKLATQVGPAGILAFLFVMIASSFMALSLARLTQLYPQEGSFYLYAKQWGGHAIGLVASGCYFIGLLIALGLLAQIAGGLLHHFIPGINAYILGIAIICMLTFLNMCGVKSSALSQRFIIACTLFPLIAVTLLCFAYGSITNLMPFAPYGWHSVLQSTRMVVFSFFGFECATTLVAIVDNPQKNLPRALIGSILLVGSLYLLFIAAIMYGVPSALFAGAQTPLPETLAQVFPQFPWLIKAIHLAMISAIMGAMHSIIWGASNLLVSIMHICTPHNHSACNLKQPKAALLVGSVILISYISFHNLDLFFNLTAVFIVSAFILSFITLLTLKSEWKSRRNIITILGLVCAIIIWLCAFDNLLSNLRG